MTAKSIFQRGELLDSLDNDEAVVREIIDMFLRDTRLRLTAIQKAIAAADYMELCHLAHAIKGSASYVYAPAIREAAARLEEQAKNGLIQACEYGKLADELAKHFQEFASLLDQEPI